MAISKNKSDMVKMLTSAGGTILPSSLPALDEKPDPMLSEPPPWAAENCNGIAHNHEIEICGGNRKFLNLGKKNSEAFENMAKIKLLDGKSPATTAGRIKICLSSILRRKNKDNALGEDDKKEHNSYFKKRSAKLKSSFSNLLRRKKKQIEVKDKKPFVKIWLESARGQSLKMYTFRKEE
eukprot:GFUD01001143.1.p1 GENE.GFUD01001143.1~~GFUD01001143.1.p1  ORF type:complete len:180 (-),score=44.84 GFUD01001143.1:579-1118(-)